MIARSHARFAIGAGRFSLRTLLLGWAVAEIVAFVLVIKLLGLGGAILLSLATSLVGLVILRRIGFEATHRLRAVMVGGTPPGGALLDGVLEGLGAVLLILPGFVSDLAGLALAAPTVRQRIAVLAGSAAAAPTVDRPAPKSNPDIIDLSPSDWRVVERPDAR